MKRLWVFAALALTACEQQQGGEAVLRAEIGRGDGATTIVSEVVSACSPDSFEDIIVTHCTANPARHTIATALNNQEGAPYASLETYAESLGEASTNVAFALNAGSYGEGGIPDGYLVTQGERLVELNQEESGTGNFHLQPNGVFYGSGSTWQIKSTEDFYSTVLERPQFGTQSGPMLVIDGAIHPEISENGPSRAIRSGVGVDEQGNAHFVISEMPVSFGSFARYFRDSLETPNALYLDGDVSSLWDPATDRLDSGRQIFPMIVVNKIEESAP